MTGLRRALWALAAAGVVCGLGALALVFTSEFDKNKTITLVFGPLIGWSFIGTGLYAWWRRPHNNFGFLMTAVGFTWFAGALFDSSTPGIFAVGLLSQALPFGFLIHLLLAFPEGRLEGRLAKGLALWAYLEVTVLQVANVLVQDTTTGDCHCIANPLLVTHDKALRDAVVGFQTITSAIGLIVITVFLWHRWRRSAAPQRRALGPMYLAGALTMVLTAISLTANVTSFSNGVESVVDLFTKVTLLAVPFGFLVGLMRSRLARGGGVSDLMTRMGAGETARPRALLAEALEDPTLEIVYWLPEREVYVSEDGREIELPGDDPSRSVTEIAHDGGRVAAIVHDPALDDSRDHVRAAGAAVVLALENERLDAELRARLEELRASRERLVRGRARRAPRARA